MVAFELIKYFTQQQQQTKLNLILLFENEKNGLSWLIAALLPSR